VRHRAGLARACLEVCDMDIKAFAEKYRVKVRRDDCGDEIIPGRQLAATSDRTENRSHVCGASDDARLGICLFYPTAKRWNFTQRLMIAADRYCRNCLSRGKSKCMWRLERVSH
jgi:hypothetical protein